jgi:hypothetical protein
MKSTTRHSKWTNQSSQLFPANCSEGQITRLAWYASNIELSATNAFLPNWDPVGTRLDLVSLLVALRTALRLRLVDTWVMTFLFPLSANASSHVALLGRKNIDLGLKVVYDKGLVNQIIC